MTNIEKIFERKRIEVVNKVIGKPESKTKEKRAITSNLIAESMEFLKIAKVTGLIEQGAVGK